MSLLSAGATTRSQVACPESGGGSLMVDRWRQTTRLRCQHQVALLVVQLQRLVNGRCSLLGSAGQREHLSQAHQRIPMPLEPVGLLGQLDRRPSKTLGFLDRATPSQHPRADTPPADLGVNIVQVGCRLADLGEPEGLVIMALLDEYFG